MDKILPTPSVEQLSTCELTIPYKKTQNIKHNLGIKYQFDLTKCLGKTHCYRMYFSGCQNKWYFALRTMINTLLARHIVRSNYGARTL